MATPVYPRTGPCSSWVTAAQVLQQPSCEDLPPQLAADMALAASELLYILSGQQFTGVCGPVEVRPEARPTDQDTRSAGRWSPGGYSSSWGYCSSWGMPHTGAESHYGCSNPPEVELGAYPVTSITLVKIDGTVIPPSEYYLQDFRKLIRRRPSAAATPTARYGWPTCQLKTLPDTEQGTFSITYKYGSPPPQSGVNACAWLAAQMALQSAGTTSDLPNRMTSISREGVTVQVPDAMAFLKDGRTGMYVVDLFLQAVNPDNLKRPAQVWSPDMTRPKRMPTGIN